MRPTAGAYVHGAHTDVLSGVTGPSLVVTQMSQTVRISSLVRVQRWAMQSALITQIVGLAERRAGYISTDDMLAAGASQSWIIRQATGGWLVRESRGWYRIGADTIELRRHAGVGGGGPDAMLIGFHGLAAWRIRTCTSDSEPVVVWTPTRHRSREHTRYTNVPWVVPTDARRIGSLVVASREVCIASVAARLEAVDLVALIKEAAFRDPDVVRRLALLIDERSFRGSQRLAVALDWYRHGHCGLDSRTEKSVRTRLHALGAAEMIVNPYLELSDGLLRVDVYWDRGGLVLEVNPEGHKRDWVKIGDLGRSARCVRDGLDVYSLDTTRPAGEQHKVLLQVAARSHQPRTGPYVNFRTHV